MKRSACRLLRESCTVRRGITLLEVLIALAIFMGAFTAISQIMRTGTQAANRAQQQNEATLRARSLLNEVVAGIVPLQSVQQAPFEDSELYYWSINVGDGPLPDLFLVEVTVARRNQDGTFGLTVTLSRYVRNPDVYLN